jgi:Kef-type K+ transport system membrane component KefB
MGEYRSVPSSSTSSFLSTGIIITMGQLLSLGLGKIKQPKVIAEVLAGILLGQSILITSY